MKIIGIDPSFTSCGVALVEDLILKETLAIHKGGAVYKGIDSLNKTCSEIVSELEDFIEEYKPDAVIVEYPAQSKSGFYLMTLHGWIMSLLFKYNIKVFSVPPTACDSFIKNKEHSKSFIVNYCKAHGWVPEKRINNDICTAVVLCHLLEAYKNKEYKNKVFRVI